MDRIVKILGAKYEKANLAKVAASAVHLMEQERKKLFQLLHSFEDLFDRTLREWKTNPVDFKMVEGA